MSPKYESEARIYDTVIEDSTWPIFPGLVNSGVSKVMKVLITGNKGFVGAATERYLKEQGVEVIGYDIMDGFDLMDIEQFAKIVLENKPDRILHEAKG